MTRARKRRKEGGSSETAAKKAKVEMNLRGRAGKSSRRGEMASRLRGSTARRSKGVEGSSGKALAEGTKSVPMGRSLISHDDWEKEAEERWEKFPATACPGLGVGGGSQYCDQHDLWYEPECIQYREITGYPHLNPCASTLEILNIGGSNVLGEFIPFLLLHTPRLKSLGQWLNTMIYGLEILKDLPEHKDYISTSLQEFSYSSDRNYFCQPYIGFVPESQEFKNVRKEMVRYSSKSAQRCGHKQRLHSSKRRQIQDDIELMVTTCPELRKVNLVVHYKVPVLDDSHIGVWAPLLRLKHLVELDLVTMRFDNVRALLAAVGPQLERLTVECDEEQGNGSEIVHLARHCPNITSLRILLGDKILRGEMTLHFGQVGLSLRRGTLTFNIFQTFFRKLERLTVEGHVHLHGFAFLWGHCQALKYLRIGEHLLNNILTHSLSFPGPECLLRRLTDSLQVL